MPWLTLPARPSARLQTTGAQGFAPGLRRLGRYAIHHRRTHSVVASRISD